MAVRKEDFGRNASKPYGIDIEEATIRASSDLVEQRRQDYRDRRDPHHLTFGPKNRREFLLFQV